jgi:hypothetical protein
MHCSRSDVITGAGGAAVTGDGGAIAGIGLTHITVNNSDIKAYSLPDSADPLFSTSAGMFIGTEDGDTLAAHAQFAARGGAPYASAESANLTGAYIYFSAADSLDRLNSDSVALFPSDTLGWPAPVDRTKRQCEYCGTDGSIGRFTLGGAENPGSVELPDSIANSLFDARRSTDEGAFVTAAFSISDYTGTPLRLNKPYIILRVAIGDSTVADTIDANLTRYTVFEGEKAQERAGKPYSSQLSKRTAVFKVNMVKTLETLSDKGLLGGEGELLYAMAAVSPDTDSQDTKNPGRYEALILDTLLTRGSLLDTVFASQWGMQAVPAAPYRTHPFEDAMRIAMGKYGPGNREPYIYVYLRPVAEGSAILWKNPHKIETVFHSRSR